MRKFKAVPGRGVVASTRISASTSADMKAEIIRRLSVPGVEHIELKWQSPTSYRGELTYSDGSTSVPFTASFDVNRNIDKDAPPAFEWNSNYEVDTDGSVWLDGKRVGWITKIVTRKPVRIEYDYDTESIMISYGGRSIELTDSNGEDVADILR